MTIKVNLTDKDIEELVRTKKLELNVEMKLEKYYPPLTRETVNKIIGIKPAPKRNRQKNNPALPENK